VEAVVNLPPTLEAAMLAMGKDTLPRFIEHLNGGTSADWLSGWLTRMGTPVSATTIRTYRRAAKQKGE
jgi:hypothetical protein